MKFLRFLLLSIVIATLSQASVYASSKNLNVSLAVKNGVDYLKESNEIIVNFSLKNEGNKTVRILKWATPFTAIENDVFEVRVNGEPVAYLGRLYKRQKPVEDDFIKLGPGESITRDVNLSLLYDFSQSGHYSIRYRVLKSDLLYTGKKRSASGLNLLTSDAVEMWIDGRSLLGELNTTESVADTYGSISYVSCTNSEKNALVSALSSAKSISSGAYSYLGSMSTNSTRYDTWFGNYNYSRWNEVYGKFSKIYDALANKSITFDCSCNSNAYAYVYPGSPYRIYLCNAFWYAPTTGTDSKSGTLVHEMSHFYVVASTKDYVYGQSGAKNLANTDPAKAIDNADNLEYFAENTPYLP